MQRSVAERRAAPARTNATPEEGSKQSRSFTSRELFLIGAVVVGVYLLSGRHARQVCNAFATVPAAVFTHRQLIDSDTSFVSLRATLIYWTLTGILSVADEVFTESLAYFFGKFLLLAVVLYSLMHEYGEECAARDRARVSPLSACSPQKASITTAFSMSGTTQNSPSSQSVVAGDTLHSVPSLTDSSPRTSVSEGSYGDSNSTWKDAPSISDDTLSVSGSSGRGYESERSATKASLSKSRADSLPECLSMRTAIAGDVLCARRAHEWHGDQLNQMGVKNELSSVSSSPAEKDRYMSRYSQLRDPFSRDSFPRVDASDAQLDERQLNAYFG